jgi:uncharacterized protein (DUF169 family)
MSSWPEKSQILKDKLRLRTEPIAYRRLAKAEELGKIKNVRPWTAGQVFCQAPFLARVQKMTVGVTNDDNLGVRCKRIHGLLATDEKAMEQEAAMLANTWMPSIEEGMKQQHDYPRIPPGEAIVLAPLGEDKFEPEVILIYGNPAQIMMLMCGMQKIEYERFTFHFIGEGACADSLGQCYTTGKPAVAIPCYGERAMGQVKDDEIVIALPPGEIDRAIKGMTILEKIGFRYPISEIGGMLDPSPLLAAVYPPEKTES